MKADIPELRSMRPEPRRDHTGKYLLPHPDDAGVTSAWDRATTLAGAHEDHGSLEKWKLRMALQGVASKPELIEPVLGLVAQVEAADGWRAASGPKKALDRIADEACDLAGAYDGSTWGTLLHTITEWADAGRLDEVIEEIESWEQGKSLLGDLEVYRKTMAENGLVCPPEYIERIMVNTKCNSAGTMDRLVRLPDGRLVVGDLKGLALDTPLPTPTGWTTMAEVRPGDRVFDAYGDQCTVAAKSEVKQIGTYVVRFDDGSEIVCDAEHIWWTQRDFHGKADPEPRSIAEVIRTLTGPHGQKWHRVPVAGALELPVAELPVDPYTLGVWIGNGDRSGGVITGMEDLLATMITSGCPTGAVTRDPRNKAVRWTVLGLRTSLRQAGLLGHKTIPDRYLRASYDQRLALLQGLMDSDGTWNDKRRRASFSTVSKALSHQVVELLHTLGQRAKTQEVHGVGYGKEVTSYPVEFTPVDLNPFRLPRKAEQADASAMPTTRARRRVVVSVEPGPDVPTACIAVDSPTRTYLCGEQMIPTHNTQSSMDFGCLKIAAQLAEYAFADCLVAPDGKSTEPMPADLDPTMGLIMWLPVGQAKCELILLGPQEMELGWSLAQHAAQTMWFRSIAKSVRGRPYDPSCVTSPVGLLSEITHAESVEHLDSIWRRPSSRRVWSDEHTAAAKARKAELKALA